MKPNLLLVFILILTFWSCSGTKMSVSVAEKQGLRGFVAETKGNQMPMKGAPKKMTKKIQCIVSIYEPLSIQSTEPMGPAAYYTAIHRPLIKEAETDSLGNYSIDLPPGKYSVLIQLEQRYYAPSYDSLNQLSVYEVLPNAYTTANLVLKRTATY